MAGISPIVLIITLKVNELSLLVKNAEIDNSRSRNNPPTICSLQETHFKYEDAN